MLIGHQRQWNFLKKAAEAKRFSHAYLFAGQEKLGKKTLALEWVSFLTELLQEAKVEKSAKKASFLLPPSLSLGSAKKSFSSFVESRDSETKIKKRFISSAVSSSTRRTKFSLTNHPDLIFITPEAKEIQIFQIRDLIWKLSLKPSLAPLKIAIIDNAHLMNQEAQSSLLKTLEEPRGETLLILISDKTQELFPTILSRVQTIRFNSVRKEEIENYLLNQGISKRETEEISALALGRPGIALDLISNKQKLENFTQRITELNKLLNSAFYFRFQYVKNLIKEDKSSFPSSPSRATAKGSKNTLCSFLPSSHKRDSVEEEILFSSPSLRKSSVAEDLESIKDILDIWLSYLRNILLSRAIAKGEEEDLSSSPSLFSPSSHLWERGVKMRTKFSSPTEPNFQSQNENFAKYSIIKIKNIIDRIQTTKFLLSNTNVNSRLVLETLMIELN